MGLRRFAGCACTCTLLLQSESSLCAQPRTFCSPQQLATAGQVYSAGVDSAVGNAAAGACRRSAINCRAIMVWCSVGGWVLGWGTVARY